MSGGLCLCLLLALLSASSLGQQPGGSPGGAELGPSPRAHPRPLRAPAAPAPGPLRPAPRPDGGPDHRHNLAALLAKYLQQARKGPTGRLSVMGSRVQSIDPTHRINDRDYMGWMDFGRRSAEEYEYSS